MLRSVVKDVSYRPCLSRGRELASYDIHSFDINRAEASGLITLMPHHTLGYSVWVTPKRTRSFPFARMYNTYSVPKKVTIIPVIKDEGLAGDLDRINAITFSWMSLANIYIILAYYADAHRHKRLAGKITAQQLDAVWVNERLQEVANYHQSALHWNTTHFQRDFVHVYQNAVTSYDRLSRTLGIAMHDVRTHERKLAQFLTDGAFDIHKFKHESLQGAQSAALREQATTHSSERLQDGDKAVITIENMLGGQYYLTIDEIYVQGSDTILQESKNSTKTGLPSIASLQDGLFKLMLFANMSALWVNDTPTSFRTRLKITGSFKRALLLPASSEAIQAFAQEHQFRSVQLLRQLNDEANYNPPLEILMTPNA